MSITMIKWQLHDGIEELTEKMPHLGTRLASLQQLLAVTENNTIMTVATEQLPQLQQNNQSFQYSKRQLIEFGRERMFSKTESAVPTDMALANFEFYLLTETTVKVLQQFFKYIAHLDIEDNTDNLELKTALLKIASQVKTIMNEPDNKLFQRAYLATDPIAKKLLAELDSPPKTETILPTPPAQKSPSPLISKRFFNKPGSTNILDNSVTLPSLDMSKLKK